MLSQNPSNRCQQGGLHILTTIVLSSYGLLARSFVRTISTRSLVSRINKSHLRSDSLAISAVDFWLSDSEQVLVGQSNVSGRASSLAGATMTKRLSCVKFSRANPKYVERHILN